MKDTPIIGHAAFYPHDGTGNPRSLAPTKDNMRIRIEELERENAVLKNGIKSLVASRDYTADQLRAAAQSLLKT